MDDVMFGPYAKTTRTAQTDSGLWGLIDHDGRVVGYLLAANNGYGVTGDPYASPKNSLELLVRFRFTDEDLEAATLPYMDLDKLVIQKCLEFEDVVNNAHESGETIEQIVSYYTRLAHPEKPANPEFGEHFTVTRIDGFLQKDPSGQACLKWYNGFKSFEVYRAYNESAQALLVARRSAEITNSGYEVTSFDELFATTKTAECPIKFPLVSPASLTFARVEKDWDAATTVEHVVAYAADISGMAIDERVLAKLRAARITSVETLKSTGWPLWHENVTAGTNLYNDKAVECPKPGESFVRIIAFWRWLNDAAFPSRRQNAASCALPA